MSRIGEPWKNRQRRAVHARRQEGLRTLRLVHRHATTVLLVDLVLPAAELDFLGSGIGTEEDDFSGPIVDADVVENVLQRYAGPTCIRR